MIASPPFRLDVPHRHALHSWLFFLDVAQAQRKSAAPDPDKPKIRAITAFINLDRTQYQPQIADAMKMLNMRAPFSSPAVSKSKPSASPRSLFRSTPKD